jgi:drug/metabolite transporter (DMT)-like permease
MTESGRAGAAARPHRQPLLLAGLGAVTISSSAVLVVLAGASAVSTAFYRSALALPLLAGLAAIERRRLGRRAAAQRGRAVLAGGFLAVDLILWTHAIYEVGAGVATVLGNLQVLFVALIAWVAWRERPGVAVAVALPVVLTGVVLVSGVIGGPRHAAGYGAAYAAGLHPLAGIWYGLGTSLAYAGYLLTLRTASAGTAHVAGPVADASAGTAIAALAFGLVFGGLTLHPLWPAIGWLAMLALLSQVAGWLLITASLPRLPAVASSLMLLLQPAVSLALAALILGQRVTPLQIVGAVLTCGGAVAASLAAATRAAATRAAATRAAATRAAGAGPSTAGPPRSARTARSAWPRRRSGRPA